jgi:hypothetical protein
MAESKGKSQPAHAARRPNASSAIESPLADWAPLNVAPFLCTRSSGYVPLSRSGEWQKAMQADIEPIIDELKLPPSGKWSSWASKDGSGIFINAMDFELFISPRGLTLSRKGFSGHWLFVGFNDDSLKKALKDNLHFPQYADAIHWHWKLANSISILWSNSFADNLVSGAIYLMARKNTVFAPFERITWDQWQYFSLDKDETRTAKLEDAFHDARPLWWHPARFNSATGPAGERLFAIHIAPGVVTKSRDRQDKAKAEEQCLRLLRQRAQIYPKEKGRELVFEAAQKEIPHLTWRGFMRCVGWIKVQLGEDSEWLSVGRPSEESSQQ